MNPSETHNHDYTNVLIVTPKTRRSPATVGVQLNADDYSYTVRLCCINFQERHL